MTAVPKFRSRATVLVFFTETPTVGTPVKDKPKHQNSVWDQTPDSLRHCVVDVHLLGTTGWMVSRIWISVKPERSILAILQGMLDDGKKAIISTHWDQWRFQFCFERDLPHQSLLWDHLKSSCLTRDGLGASSVPSIWERDLLVSSRRFSSQQQQSNQQSRYTRGNE